VLILSKVMTHYMAIRLGLNQDFVFTYHTASRTQWQKNRRLQIKRDIQTEGKNCNFLVEERPECSDIRPPDGWTSEQVDDGWSHAAAVTADKVPSNLISLLSISNDS